MPYKDPTSAAAKASAKKRSRKWDLAHPEYHRLYQRTERSLETKRAWKKRNPEYPKRKWQNVKSVVFDLYGRKCVRCGFSDMRALQLDHVKDDGNLNRIRKRDGKRVTKTQPAWYDAMKSYRPEKYQILCANCNWIKRHERENKA